MKKSKNLAVAAGVIALMLSAPTISQAGQWIKEDRGWRYQYEDGTFATGGEYFIDDNKDDIWEVYCFDDNGYLLTNYKKHESGFNIFTGSYSYDLYYGSDGRRYYKETGEIVTCDMREEVAALRERELSDNANFKRIGEGKIKPEILELLCRSEDYVKNHYAETIEAIVERGQNDPIGMSHSYITYSNGVEFHFSEGYLTNVEAKNPSLLLVGAEADDSLQQIINILGEGHDDVFFPGLELPERYFWNIKDPTDLSSSRITVIYDFDDGGYSITRY